MSSSAHPAAPPDPADPIGPGEPVERERAVEIDEDAGAPTRVVPRTDAGSIPEPADVSLQEAQAADPTDGPADDFPGAGADGPAHPSPGESSDPRDAGPDEVLDGVPGSGSSDDTAGGPTDAAGFTWLLADFAGRVPRVRHILAVSADGLLMAMSPGLDRTQGDTVAAIVAGLTSLVRGASGHLRGGAVRQAIVEMDEAFLITVSVSEGAVLAVVAEADCDVGLVGYEVAVLASRAESAITPQLIDDARAMLPIGDVGASVP